MAGPGRHLGMAEPAVLRIPTWVVVAKRLPRISPYDGRPAAFDRTVVAGRSSPASWFWYLPVVVVGVLLVVVGIAGMVERDLVGALIFLIGGVVIGIPFRHIRRGGRRFELAIPVSHTGRSKHPGDLIQMGATLVAIVPAVLAALDGGVRVPSVLAAPAVAVVSFAAVVWSVADRRCRYHCRGTPRRWR